MKKICTFLILLLAAGVVRAQRFEGNTVIERTKFGIQAGLSIPYQEVGNASTYYDAWGNYYTGGDGYYSDAKAGYTAGLQLEIPLRNGWYLQPEANYTQMGGKDYIKYLDENGEPYSVYSRQDYNYLQVPILFKYKPFLRGFGIFGGPQYSYLLSAKNHFYDGVADDDVKSTLYKSEFSFVFGLEYYFPTRNDGPSFGLSLRGMSGITNILDKSKVSVDQPSIRNQGVTLTAGVRF